MKISELQTYKKILILGMGKEGASAKRFIERVAPGSVVDTADIKDGPDYLKKQDGANLVVRSPGVHTELVTKKYTTATNLFFANCPGQTIGVTGTKGKSTTASLVAAMLKKSIPDVRLVGNIGCPMLDELGSSTADTVFVVELSSYQLTDINYSPHIVVIVNWFPEHRDFHGSFELYKQSKERVLSFQTPSDYFIFDPSEEPAKWGSFTKAHCTPYATDFPFDENKIHLLGLHNKKNIQAALTVARLYKVSEEKIAEAVYGFVPLPHRLEKVGTFKGITFYDDAISTTPQSTIAALNTLHRVETIFLGGQDRGYEFDGLIKVLKEKNIKNIVLFPDTGKRIKEGITKMNGYSPSLLEISDMEQAVKFAYEKTTPGATCLLSTASPSYSVWKNFEEKGDLFQQFVRSIGEQHETTSNG